jgi:hypothetical protein
MASRLKSLPATHRLASRSAGLVSGENGTRAASPAAITTRADIHGRSCGSTGSRCMKHATRTRLMIAAGINAKALSTYMGHANTRSRSTATDPDARQRGGGSVASGRVPGALSVTACVRWLTRGWLAPLDVANTLYVGLPVAMRSPRQPSPMITQCSSKMEALQWLRRQSQLSTPTIPLWRPARP